MLTKYTKISILSRNNPQKQEGREMPRGPRLDAPGTLHHVIIRGIEKGLIVRDDEDRKNFIGRMGALAKETGTAIYAWALMSNHSHMLLRSGKCGIPAFMRRLLTGYAVTYPTGGTIAGAMYSRTDTSPSYVKKASIF